jgi:hypothetical protein
MLTALRAGPLHGHAISKSIKELSGGRVQPLVPQGGRENAWHHRRPVTRHVDRMDVDRRSPAAPAQPRWVDSG